MSESKQLYVLYGSQMGNSEEAANLFCKQLTEKFTNDEYMKSHSLPCCGALVKDIKTICIQLDDFLELHHSKFTQPIVIFVSSYGVGQAPLGAYRFRELCEEFLSLNDQTLLKGLKYAICGLGDSSYPTYLKNPTTIDNGLQAAGAIRIAPLAKADAQEVTGTSNAQDKVIQRFIDLIIPKVGKVLLSENQNEDVDLIQMQQNIIPLLCKLDPDYKPPPEKDNDNNQKKKKGGLLGMFGLGTAVALAGIGLAISSMSSSSSSSS